MTRHDLIVEAFLKDVNFHAQESDERRRELAASLAQVLVDERLVEETEPEFIRLEGTSDIILESANNGELIRFRNAILCREETNKNGDIISADNITELAASISGRAADIDHVRVKNCGIITAARAGTDKGKAALFVDGLLWRDRYPVEVDGVRAGTHQLSVEAMADYAVCSVCQGEFGRTDEYCNHLRARKSSGAKRAFKGLHGKGMGITPKPAGTAYFDRDQIFVVANHQEDETMNCPHCGAEATGDKCPACNKSTVPSVIAAELKTAIEQLNSLQASAETLKTEKTEVESKVADLQTRLEAAEEKVKQAEVDARKVRDESRTRELAALLSPDKLSERKDALLGLDDTAFNAVTASLKEAANTTRKNGGAAIRLGAPDNSANNGAAKKLSLR